MTPSRPLARDLTPESLSALALELGAKPFQARSLVTWVHTRGLRDLERATDLPAALRQALAERLDLAAARIAATSESGDGTRKLLLALRDGESVEMVLIPEGERSTLCISTQVGCPVACVFCASGLLGVRRNLSSAEIVEQFLIAREELGERPLTNLVVMGIGEPMLNLKHLLPALRQISSAEGFGFSPRRITVSTSGYPERIADLMREGRPYNLAISLHAAEPELRKHLVPTATAEPKELVAAAADYFRATGREPTFEVVLLAGLNDGLRHAEALATLLHGQACTVNLLPWNPVEGVPLPLRTPADHVVEEFRAQLESLGIKVTWRRRRGADRDAACGQLRLRELAAP